MTTGTRAAASHVPTPVSGSVGTPVEASAPSGIVGRRLKVLSVLVPIAFVTLLELGRYLLENSPAWSNTLLHTWRVALYAGFVVCIAVFAFVMVRLIERAERSVVRQNRDLLTANALSTYAHGHDATPHDVIRDAAATLVGTSGAERVRLRLYGATDTDEATIEAVDGPRTLAEQDTVPLVDRPLRNDGNQAVGRLEVWARPGSEASDWIGPQTEAALSTQIASAVQLTRAFGELYRRRDEGHAFYNILLEISRQAATLPTLTTIAGHARELLGADAAAVVVNVATANSVRFDEETETPVPRTDGAALFGVGLPEHDDPATGLRVNPIGCLHWASFVECPVVGPSGALGSLWVGTYQDRPFTERDSSFLGTLAGLAGIALTSAQVREHARQREVLNERTRIAREMHDSLAQVLGAVHLRLRMVQTFDEVVAHDELAADIEALAQTCDEGYRDVREVILGLRDAHVLAERGLEENLRAYLDKYTASSGVATEFRNETGGELVLSPRAEVHLIRVVQEALTNVRKHAAATTATVTVSATDTTTTFTIADDGRGFHAPDDAPTTEGYGLFTMRDRLTLLGGHLRITSTPGGGTQVVATVPEPPQAGGTEGGTP